MGTITYNGPEESVRLGGKTLKKGESVEFEDDAVLAKSVGNPYFDVSGYEPKPITTTTTTVDNPNVDPSKQAKWKEGEDPNRRPGIGTVEPLAVEQEPELRTAYPDARNKADVGGEGVGPGIKVDPKAYLHDEPSDGTNGGKSGAKRDQAQRDQDRDTIKRDREVRERTEAAQRAAQQSETATKRR